jgi:hypothetical protein
VQVTLRKVEFEQATIHLPALHHSQPHHDGAWLPIFSMSGLGL